MTENLHAIIQEHCAATATEWRITAVGPSRQWLLVRHRDARTPEQGWKLHLAAGLASAVAVLRRALPVLLAECVEFKVAASLQELAALNTGEHGLSQIGKFITVYPRDDAQAVRLAAALDGATRGLRGPAVPLDLPLAPGSLVHYRYGSFVERYVQAADGAILPAIVAPTGELLPDRRLAAAPEWAADPFQAAGIAVAAPAPAPLVGGRYLVVGLLSSSARGTVARAVDIRMRRPCVLKRAARDALMRQDGQDARDGLRHEVAVLGQLAPDPRFPALLDRFEHEQDLIMVLEDLPGETLERYVQARACRGCLPANARIVAWGRELAAMLVAIHARGLAYRDLKSANVIIAPDRHLRLVDFDAAAALGSTEPPHGLGTRGSMSLRQAAGAPPSIGDDIYGLGALLYFLATGAAPAQAPRPLSLLDRPIRRLNPLIAPGIEQVIARCLDRDPGKRFASAEALAAALATTEAAPAEGEVIPPKPVRCGPGWDTATKAFAPAPDRFSSPLDLAQGLGDRLCQAARPAPGGGLAWETAELRGTGIHSRNLYDGVAGVVLALSALVALSGRDNHRSALAEGARWLAQAPAPPGQLIAGLYVGEAGVAAALLRAGQVLGDDALVSAALDRGRWIATLPYAGPDVMIGTAGRLRFHLLLWAAGAAPEQLQAAVAAGERLLATGRAAGEAGLQWAVPAGADGHAETFYLGYAHGSAGIADTLLDLFEATGSERFLDAARGIGRRLAGLAVPALDDGRGLNWPRIAGDAPSDCGWCHGATGIGRFLLHLAALEGLPEAPDLAARAAQMVAHGARWIGPTQCHGLAGSIELLLDAAGTTGDRRYLDEAYALAPLLEAWIDDHHEHPAELPDTLPPGFMVGYAGILACLLRLGHPDTMHHLVSRNSFGLARSS